MLKTLILVLALAATPALSACETLGLGGGGPCHVEGATEAETPKLCVIKAANTVRSSYAAISEQLQRGVITVSQAESAKLRVDQAASVVKSAETALAVGDGTLDDKLALLEALTLELLRMQAK